MKTKIFSLLMLLLMVNHCLCRKSCTNTMGKRGFYTGLLITDCSNRHLTTVPHEEIDTNTQVLNLAKNGFTSLSMRSFQDYSALKYIDLGSNKLKDLPGAIFQNLTKLQKIILRNNHLTTLPETIFRDLSELKYVGLGNNQLTSLPETTFQNLTALQIIHLRRNQLKKLSQSTFLNVKSLFFLDISRNKLSSLPEAIFEKLTALQQIDLSANSLSTLSELTFRDQAALNYIDLAKNNLVTLPKRIFRYSLILTTINLQSNKLTNLPKTIFRTLTSIQDIDLSNNELTSLPETILQNMTTLFRVDISSNRLITLPDAIFKNLYTLEYLSLKSMQLELSPTIFSQLRNMNLLNVGKITMHCTYDSLYQMWMLKKKSKLNYQNFFCDRTNANIIEQEDTFMEREPSSTSKSAMVYVSTKGSRNSSCGAKNSPCKFISDVLFQRKESVTVYLEANSNIQLVYRIDLPLNLNCTVKIKKYPDNTLNPIIQSFHPVLFIIQGNAFSMDGVDLDLPPESVAVELDNFNVLSISLFNMQILNHLINIQKQTAVLVKFYQHLQIFNVHNVTISSGNLLRLQGTHFLRNNTKLVTNIDHITISNSSAQKLIAVQGYQCAIKIISIDNCRNVGEYGILLKNTDCNIDSLSISRSTLRQAAVSIRRNNFFKVDYKRMLLYMKNVPHGITLVGKTEESSEDLTLVMKDVKMIDNVASNLIEIVYSESNKGERSSVTITDSIFTNNVFRSCVEAKNIDMRIDRISINQNKITKHAINHKYGNFYLSSLEIKENTASADTIPLMYFAMDLSAQDFTLIDAVINWTRTDTHPALLDLYFANGKLKVRNVTVLSNAINPVTMLSSEVGLNHDPPANISDLTIICQENSDAVHEVIKSIRYGNSLKAYCRPCGLNSYTNRMGQLKLLTKSHQKNFLQNLVPQQDTDFKCHNCPVGGVCKLGIKSSGNFYGYRIKDGKVAFKPCPKNYCCTYTKCDKINTCGEDREGLLCGKCKEGFHLDFVSDACIKSELGGNIIRFWLFFWLISFVVCTLFIYMKNISTFFKGIGRKIKLTSPCRKPEKKCVNDNDEITLDVLINPEIKCQNKSENKSLLVVNETPKTDQMTLSGCFNIIVGFYQIRSLLTVDVGGKYKKANSFQSRITLVMDLDFFFIKAFHPMDKMNAIYKGLIRNHLLVCSMLVWAFVFLLVFNLAKLFRKKMSCRRCKENTDPNCLTFPERVGLAMLKMVLFGYKNVATFSIVLFHCVEIESTNVLFIYGSQKCYQSWQFVCMVFVIVWVIPFPAALMVSYRLYKNHIISIKEFLLCSAIPYLALIYRCRQINLYKDENGNQKEVFLLLSEYFEDPYRETKRSNHCVFWETWRLYQRLILAFIVTFSINPVNRICYVAPIILIFIMVYWIVRPYKPQLNVLHWMEAVSLLGITFSLINNMFRSFLYVFQIPDEHPIPISLNLLYWIDSLASPIFVLVYFYVVKPFLQCLKKAFQKCYTSDA